MASNPIRRSAFFLAYDLLTGALIDYAYLAPHITQLDHRRAKQWIFEDDDPRYWYGIPFQTACDWTGKSDREWREVAERLYEEGDYLGLNEMKLRPLDNWNL